jgi:diaminohydroxyphosphoribosylaminopyrimidine deaminase/5-amino-6-(5-phosphoribosylamino)uracil reductase
MRRAIELAQQGIGFVEPNPAVGAVLVAADRTLLGEGWHEKFGEPHAEVNAFSDFVKRHPNAETREQLAATATLFVTLEPCCHIGKTPPCTEAVLASGVRRVIIGLGDPSPHVDGGGIAQLEQAGLEVSVGLLEPEVRQLNAPFLKLTQTGLPYVHVKWAMTLDGKIATRTGSSQWISNEKSRAVVHELRGRMDAVIVGAGTARADDPCLTARPSGPRIATRIVVDSRAGLPLDSQLVRTAAKAPVLVAALNDAPSGNVEALRAVGVEVLLLESASSRNEAALADRLNLKALLSELGRRGMTNVLVEGGGGLLGSLFDLCSGERPEDAAEAGGRLIDEIHVFVAPKIAGGAEAIGPIGGFGLDRIPQSCQIDPLEIETLDGDVYVHGPLVSRDSAGRS